MNLFQKTASTIFATSLIASAAQAQFSDDEIRIGYLADMSGTYRDLSGPGGLEALKMAVEDFGGQVDGKKIVIFSADDLNKPDVGANTVRQWVDERNVDMVTGMVASSVVLAASKVVEQAGKLALISGAAASSLTNEYCSPNHIHWTYDSYALANGTAKAVLANGGKSWFILTADYAFGHAMETDITKVVEAGGGSVVSKVRHPFPSSDFSSYILQAQGSGADVIALANAGADTVNSLMTASQFGVAQSGQKLAGMVVFLNDIHAMGLDVDIAGRLATGWEAYVSYTWIPKAVIDESNVSAGNAQRKGDRPGLTPKRSASFWTTYQLTPKWRVGGGVNYRSEQSPEGNRTVEAPAFTTFDLMAEYAFSDAVSIKLNGTNVTNRLYADSLYRGFYAPGAPRAFTATMKVLF